MKSIFICCSILTIKAFILMELLIHFSFTWKNNILFIKNVFNVLIFLCSIVKNLVDPFGGYF